MERLREMMGRLGKEIRERPKLSPFSERFEAHCFTVSRPSHPLFPPSLPVLGHRHSPISSSFATAALTVYIYNRIRLLLLSAEPRSEARLKQRFPI